jgi:hypothetical protein
MSDKYYCTAGCQEGSDEVRWGAHEIAWCRQPTNAAGCPKRVPPVRKADFVLREWSEVKAPESPCAAAWRKGERPRGKVERLSMGLLTHEPVSFRASMLTYKALGLFDVAIEFLIYANKRRPEIDAVAEEFRREYPDVIRVMGDAENHGIARGMTWLTGNATQPNFLFLERDFQLIEPGTCVAEQLSAGVALVESRRAHVVRFRHRKRPGRPNWASKMFAGHEDDALKGHQPNLFCNVFYWVPEPDQRWPDKFRVCSREGEPRMWCTDSFYCVSGREAGRARAGRATRKLTDRAPSAPHAPRLPPSRAELDQQPADLVHQMVERGVRGRVEQGLQGRGRVPGPRGAHELGARVVELAQVDRGAGRRPLRAPRPRQLRSHMRRRLMLSRSRGAAVESRSVSTIKRRTRVPAAAARQNGEI